MDAIAIAAKIRARLARCRSAVDADRADEDSATRSADVGPSRVGQHAVDKKARKRHEGGRGRADERISADSRRS